MLFNKHTIRINERGLLFRNGELTRVLKPGVHRVLYNREVEVVPVRAPWLTHKELDAILDSGLADEELTRIELKDHERALIWVDGRFNRVLGPGRHAAWSVAVELRVERLDARILRLEHPDLDVILEHESAPRWLTAAQIAHGQIGLLVHRGKIVEQLKPGNYAFWRQAGLANVLPMDLREQVLDVTGQDIMTADKVTLRLNAVLCYRVADPVKAVSTVSDVEQALYRETQLILRSEVGLRKLDNLLGEKDAVAAATADILRGRATDFGLELCSLGIRDLILPGDMRELMNQVIEARKMAEANVIRRREETSAVRSQLNTARLMESNPTLMRLRELEVLERVATDSNLQVLLGDEGLREKVTRLI